MNDVTQKLNLLNSLLGELREYHEDADNKVNSIKFDSLDELNLKLQELINDLNNNTPTH